MACRQIFVGCNNEHGFFQGMLAAQSWILSQPENKLGGKKALAKELTWLQCRPNMPRLRVRSPVRARTRVNQ